MQDFKLDESSLKALVPSLHHGQVNLDHEVVRESLRLQEGQCLLPAAFQVQRGKGSCTGSSVAHCFIVRVGDQLHDVGQAFRLFLCVQEDAAHLFAPHILRCGAKLAQPGEFQSLHEKLVVFVGRGESLIVLSVSGEE